MSEELRILKNIIETKQKPFAKLALHIREEWKDGKPRFAVVRLYRDNFEEFSENQKVVISLWISDIIKLAREAGVQTYLEVFEYAP